jgi:hypothetical protein
VDITGFFNLQTSALGHCLMHLFCEGGYPNDIASGSRPDIPQSTSEACGCRCIEIGPKRPGIARKPLELAAVRLILRAARERRKKSSGGRTAQEISSFDTHIHFSPISHIIDLYGRKIVVISRVRSSHLLPGIFSRTRLCDRHVLSASHKSFYFDRHPGDCA